MKDKKFLVLCLLGLAWISMFVAMLFGAKIHPRVEALVYVICIGWFAYWTISFIRSKPEQPKEPTKDETPNANASKITTKV